MRERSYIRLELDDEEMFDYERDHAHMSSNGLSDSMFQPVAHEESHNTYAGGTCTFDMQNALMSICTHFLVRCIWFGYLSFGIL